MRKTHLYTLLCVLCFPSLVCAQQAVFDEFRKAAGDYAALYSGKAEENYNQQKYLNHPYWNTDEFREGAVCYGRWLYSDLQLRYDTYKKESDCGYSGETDNLAGRYAESGLFCHRRTEVCTAG